MKMLVAGVVVLWLVLAMWSPAIGGDDPTCHNPPMLPTVTDWTVTPGTGSIAIDARLSGYPHIAQYYAPDPTNEPDWQFDLTFWPVGQPGPYTNMRGHGATVTDSSFHYEVPVAAGTYVFLSGFSGSAPEADLCTSPYFRQDTLTIVGATASKRTTLGGIRARWGRSWVRR